MLRLRAKLCQLQGQLYRDSLAYSCAFAPRNESVVSDAHYANCMYSPAASQVRRRKGHPERQKARTEKVRLISRLARDNVGV